MSRADRLAKGIYWDRSWNPFTGCTPFPEGSTGVREGCRNCWAKRMAYRLKGRCGYPADEPFRPTFHPERLSQVTPKQKPQVIALCFMSDPFHENHVDEDILMMLEIIEECHQHTFIALTKRPYEMGIFLNGRMNPIHNLIGGVSIWDQESADRMIPILLETNLATRIVSLEPCLGPVDMSSLEMGGPRYLGRFVCHECEDEPNGYECHCCLMDTEVTKVEHGIDGVILGGAGARPMQLEWARDVRDQCQAANVPFLFKQWGGYCPPGQLSPEEFEKWKNVGDLAWDDRPLDLPFRVGKKAAGRLLDGRTWDELPEVMR